MKKNIENFYEWNLMTFLFFLYNDWMHQNMSCSLFFCLFKVGVIIHNWKQCVEFIFFPYFYCYKVDTSMKKTLYVVTHHQRQKNDRKSPIKKFSLVGRNASNSLTRNVSDNSCTQIYYARNIKVVMDVQKSEQKFKDW